MLMQKGQLEEVPTGTYILRKGNFPEHISLLIDGVVRKVIDQDHSLLQYLGTTIGIHFVLNPNQTIDCDFKTESTCRILKISLQIISRFINKYPEFERMLCILYFRHFLQLNSKKNLKLHDVSLKE